MPFRWTNIPETNVNGNGVKIIRPRFIASKTQRVKTKGHELDWHAWIYLGSELLTYRVLDTNWERFIEERGDVSRIDELEIPVDGELTEEI